MIRFHPDVPRDRLSCHTYTSIYNSASSEVDGAQSRQRHAIPSPSFVPYHVISPNHPLCTIDHCRSTPPLCPVSVLSALPLAAASSASHRFTQSFILNLASRVSVEMDQAWMRRTQTRSKWKSRRIRDLFVVLTMHVSVPRLLRRFRVAAFQTRVFADAAKTQTIALFRGRDVFALTTIKKREMRPDEAVPLGPAWTVGGDEHSTATWALATGPGWH